MMIAVTVVAIVLLPVIGLVLGISLILQKKRGNVDVDATPLLAAAFLLVSGQALLDVGQHEMGSQFIPGNMAWVAWLRSTGCIVGYGLSRRYLGQGMWPVLAMIGVVAVGLNVVPAFLAPATELRSVLMWIGAVGTAAYIAGPSLLMALNSGRVASGRTVSIGFVCFAVAALLLVLYPTVLPATTEFGSMPGIILADVSMLSVLVGTVLTRTPSARLTA